jgi:hypothetical protein
LGAYITLNALENVVTTVLLQGVLLYMAVAMWTLQAPPPQLLLLTTSATFHCYRDLVSWQDELAVLRSSKDDSIPWMPLQVVQFHVKSSGGTNAWFMQGVPLLTYVLSTDEASDVLQRVALRRPDMLLTGASPAATSAATSNIADSKRALPRAALLWPTGFVYVDQVSRAVYFVCTSMHSAYNRYGSA